VTLKALGNFDQINNPLSSSVVGDPGERERQRNGCAAAWMRAENWMDKENEKTAEQKEKQSKKTLLTSWSNLETECRSTQPVLNVTVLHIRHFSM